MVRPNFVSKIYDIVDDPKTDHIISWINNGDAFVVWKPVELAKHVFPKYFTHTNFCSFIRQPNEYGFSRTGDDGKEFKHDYFRKDDKSLHMQIKRRKKSDIEWKRRPKIYTTRTTPTSGNPSEELEGPSNASPVSIDILVALKRMRTKIELSTKSIYAAKLKEKEAKKIWKDASKIVKEKEAQNQKLREQLLHMVQENSIIEYNLSEELERCKKALD
ncbi:winged helix-turn-helix DNA-binding domain, Heat shock transcription factor family [Artemisia annua]|uniref:Winged helix-turn-helix DNA-binding domain, Heat shock transcription factor family n=1 Tax=Artemisia annua TaxID=35608 RepID=A0A2U1LAA6_ARTAN|nr:winged helix-turn-helix DNA-binding domain, Heat shock transcription factor family [Artemisia annua]